MLESGILKQPYSVEVSKMPYLQCTGCDKTLEINIGEQGRWNVPNKNSNPNKLTGSVTCRYCGTGIGFEITDNIIVYVSGKSSYGNINENLSGIVKAFYAEAELGFQNGMPNASAAMCRASLEIALNEAGFTGRTLEAQIDKAKPPLSDIELSLAHCSRLITREAIHRGNLVELSNVPSMLSATVGILNKLVS